jgi:hypothetical protein
LTGGGGERRRCGDWYGGGEWGSEFLAVAGGTRERGGGGRGREADGRCHTREGRGRVPRIEGEAVIPGMLEWCRRADEGENGAVIPGMAPSFDGERGEGVGEGEDGGRDANHGGGGMVEPCTNLTSGRLR